MVEVERLCDNIVMMKKGEIVDKGTCSELIKKHGRENLEDTFLKSFFGNESGNCYKPDGQGAKFSSGSFVTSSFPNKTNELGDFSDVQGLYDAIHATTRTSNPTAWKAGLEAVFDVDGFLKYLAAMNTIQNWDCYGNAPHNYYLYNDPNMGKLRWIV